MQIVGASNLYVSNDPDNLLHNKNKWVGPSTLSLIISIIRLSVKPEIIQNQISSNIVIVKLNTLPYNHAPLIFRKISLLQENIMITIFIAGASASGKTKLSQLLLEELGKSGGNYVLLKMDDYFHEIPEHAEIDSYRQNTNFDRMEMLKLDLLKTHLLELNRGQAIDKPIFDFKTNRSLSSERILPPDILIVEGLFALEFTQTHIDKDLESLNVFVETDSYMKLIQRRIQRDIKERGRQNGEEVIRQECRFVGPAFFFGKIASSKQYADIVIDNSEDNPIKDHPLTQGVEVILSKLKLRQSFRESSSTFLLS